MFNEVGTPKVRCTCSIYFPWGAQGNFGFYLFVLCSIPYIEPTAGNAAHAIVNVSFQRCSLYIQQRYLSFYCFKMCKLFQKLVLNPDLFCVERSLFQNIGQNSQIASPIGSVKCQCRNQSSGLYFGQSFEGSNSLEIMQWLHTLPFDRGGTSFCSSLTLSVAA